MKKIIAIVLGVFAVVSTVFAEEEKAYESMRLGFSASYGIAALEQVNEGLNDGTSVTVMGPSVAGMLNLDMVVSPFLFAGVRTGYVYCMPGSAKYLLETIEVTENASLIPLEAGVTANIEIPGVPVSLMAGVFAGYGYAMSSVKTEVELTDSVFTQPYTGGGFVGEAVATVNFKVSSSLSVNINGSYRLAKIAQMTQSEEVEYTILGVPATAGAKGDILKDSGGDDLAFDFSGFNIGLGFSIGF